MRNVGLRWTTAAVLVLLAAAGSWLVLSGGDEADPSGATLTLEDSDSAAVAELAGLELPESTEDFLSARLDDGSQLDVTFTIDTAQEDQLIGGSSLEAPSVDERVILHSSPLWELNPEGDIRGSSDTVQTRDGTTLTRAVELVEEDGRTRVRIVITPEA